MSNLSVTTISAVIGIVGAISGVALGWSGYARTHNNKTRKDAEHDAILRTDMDYIKRGVDDIKLEQKMQHNEMNELSERVTRIEESTKQAHKRIDGIMK